MRRRVPALLPLLGAFLAAASPTSAWAETPASLPAACRGTYSVADPLPRECMEEIDTDRPHLTDTPHTVPPGHVQLEVGVASYGARRTGATPSPQAVDLFDLLFKVGLWTGVDLQVGWSAVALRQAAGDGWTAAAGRSLLLRAKVGLVGVRGGWLHLTLTPVLIVPLRDDNVGGGAFLFMGGRLPGAIDLELNLGLVEQPRDDGTSRGTLIPTMALTRQVLGPLSAYAEVYSQVTRPRDPDWSVLVAGGFLVLLTPNLQLDGGVRVGLTRDLAPWTVFGGVCVRR